MKKKKEGGRGGERGTKQKLFFHAYAEGASKPSSREETCWIRIATEKGFFTPACWFSRPFLGIKEMGGAPCKVSEPEMVRYLIRTTPLYFKYIQRVRQMVLIEFL